MLCQFGVPINDFGLSRTAVYGNVIVNKGRHFASGLCGTGEVIMFVERVRFCRHISI